MALQLIYGRSGSGKTALCLEETAKQLKADDSVVVWLTPENETFKIEKKLAERLPEQGFSNAYILGFKRLSYRVLNECGGGTGEHITELGKRLLLSRVIEEQRGEWTAFARAAAQRNFADVLGKLLEELKIYGIDAALLKKAAQNLDGAASLKDKLNDLALAYNKMAEKMADAYKDSEDYMNSLAERLPKSRLAKGSHVFVDGFRFFNPQELRVLEIFLQCAATVTVTLTLGDAEAAQPRDETDVFFRQYRTRQQLLDMARRHNVAVSERELKENLRHQKKSLRTIEEKLYQYAAQEKQADSDGVRLIEAANRRREVEAIAADILRLRREKNYRWRDIVVLVREDEYMNLAESIFADYEIPFFSEAKQAALHHPLAELLRSLLDAVSGWRYEPLFRLFKTGFFPAETSEIDRLENYVLACGIKGNSWLEDFTYFRQKRVDGAFAAINDAQAAELLELNDIRRRVISPLVAFSDKVRSAENLLGVLTAVYELLEDLEVAAKLEKDAAKAESEGRLSEGARERQIWDSIITLLEQMADICGAEKLSFDALSQLFEDGLAGLSVALIPPGLDYVTLAGFEQNNAAGVKAVYITGVNEGLIPRKAKTEGLLNDSDRLILLEMGLELPSGTASDNFGERFLIYKAFASPAEYLVLSYALADQGDGLKKSPLVNRIKELLDIKEDAFMMETILTAPHSLLGRERGTLEFLPEMFAMAEKANVAVPEIWQAVYNWGVEHCGGFLKRLMAGFAKKDCAAALSKETARRLYLEDGRLKGSVTRFEAFQKCPFRHFADYGLKLKEREIFSWQVSELGTLMHAILKLFGERLCAQKRPWGDVGDAECEAICHELVAEIAPRLQNKILLSSAYYQHLLARIERTAVKSIKRLIKLDRAGGFHAVGYEKIFGKGGELKPLIYKLKDGSVAEIRGQIDRIDTFLDEMGNEYLVIMDYKTGQIAINILEVYYGLKLQLLTYLLVAVNEMERQKKAAVIPSGMLYFFIKSQQLSCTSRRTAAEIEAEVDKALKMPGWVLADKEIVKKIDGTGRFLPIKLDKNGEFTKSSLKTLKTAGEFRTLLAYAGKILTETSEAVLAGDIAARPASLGNALPCKYCRFGAVCQLDTRAVNARLLPKLDEDAAFQKICESLGEVNNGMDS